MMRMSLVWALPLFSLAGCTSPNVSAEVGTFAKAVDGVSADYRAALAIDAGTVRRGQVDALVADRRQLVQLSPACDLLGTGDRTTGVDQCVLDDSAVVLPENSVARAETQLLLLAEYFKALDALVTSTGPTEVQNATAAALTAVGALGDALPKPELGGFVKDLQQRKEGIGKAAGFLAEQYKVGQLRKVVTQADPAVSRLVLALEDAAVASGIEPPGAAYERLRESQVAMDLASSGDPAAYRAAIEAFYAEYDAFVAYRKTGLIPRLELIAATHAALKQRLTGPATLAEVAALIERLNSLKSSFE